MFARYGLDFERHGQWQEQAVEPRYVGLPVTLFVMGAIFGASQALMLRTHRLRILPWILATVTPNVYSSKAELDHFVTALQAVVAERNPREQYPSQENES